MEYEYIKDEYIKEDELDDELEGESIKKTKYKQYIKIIMLMIIPLIFTIIIYLNPKLKNKLLKNVNFIKSNNKNTTVKILKYLSINSCSNLYLNPSLKG